MRHVCLTLVVLLAACSTSSDYDPPVQRRPAPSSSMRPQPVAMLFDILPDDTWWRDNMIAAPLNLTTEQFQALDKIATDEHDEIMKLQHDLPAASRNLRDALDADPISADDIRVATQRVRELRGLLFDRQAEMLSAERLVLTKDQWITLTDELQRRREEQRMNRGGEGQRGHGGQGGQGGYPRGGRGRPW